MDQNDNHSLLNEMEPLLNNLSRAELLELNKLIIHRVRIMDGLYQLAENAKYHIGQGVQWKDRRGILHTGTVLRINQKTISVHEDGDQGGHWNVSPFGLTPVV